MPKPSRWPFTGTALSIDEAMTKMQKTKFDVVVCDLEAPVTTTFDFLNKLRNKGDKIPFIMFAVSGEGNWQLKPRA